MITYEIKNILSSKEINALTNLVTNTFDEFVAPDYSEEGRNSFYNFINNGKIFDNMLASHEFVITAKYEEKIIGLISTRDRAHINLLFVDKTHHKKGVSKELFEYLLEILDKDLEVLTVNSSPYAFEVYKKLGFRALTGTQEKDGIKFIPMKKELEVLEKNIV